MLMPVNGSVKMNLDLENWDPMLQDFTSGKKYEEGPGADLVCKNEREQNEEAKKIILKNIPANITEEGIRNLCLSAGTPISVVITPSGLSALVTFKTIREAELAIRDLNNTAPYYLRVKFATQQHANKSSGNHEITKEVESDEGWDIESFYKCSFSKQYLSDKLTGKKTVNVSPYFPFYCEHDDPSLIMRQKSLDFKTKKECISMGRGYINTGDVDHLKYENRVFSCQSDYWNDSDCETTHCHNCGSMTFKKYEENYCSRDCETEAQSKAADYAKSTVFDSFTPGCCGVLHCLKENQDGIITCSVVLDEESKTYERLLERVADADKMIKARRGDRVIVRIAGQFLRGVVSSNEGDFYSVALIDHGKTVSVETVYKLPNDLEEIPSFGGVARFLTDCIPEFTPVKFRVKERQLLGSWLCDIISDHDNVCEVVLEAWSVPGSLTSATLKSGCNVVITTFKNMKTVFVRRTGDPWDEDFVRLSNDVANYSLNAKKYRKLPKLGEVCSARYKNDGCFYRAVVRSVRRKSVCVTFMDYGNEQETELDDLRYLPNSIREVNCFAARVRLKDVSVASSPKSVNYLNQLIAYEIELRLTCDSGEVVLTDEASGIVVNEVLSELAVPVWEKDPSVFLKSSETYFLDSVNELKFEPAQTEDVFVMNVDLREFKTNGTFWGTRNRSDYLGHLNGELKQSMTEYCSCLADEPYLPRKGELCLVEFKGNWYRGVSLDDRTLPCPTFLIDFGISTSAETKHMRKILKQFLEMPALALECRIADFSHFDDDQQEKITEYMMKMNKKILKNVRILRKLDGAYEVSVPIA